MVSKLKFLTVLFVLISLTPAFGSDGSVANRHKQTLNFEDELVEGETQKPELFYLFQRKNFNYKRLFKLREDFIPEAHRTAAEIRQRRSSP